MIFASAHLSGFVNDCLESPLLHSTNFLGESKISKPYSTSAGWTIQSPASKTSNECFRGQRRTQCCPEMYNSVDQHPRCLRSLLLPKADRRSRRESNPDLRFRKPPFYPLNYGNKNTICLACVNPFCHPCRGMVLEGQMHM